MKPSDAELMTRLDAFTFDEPGTVFTFQHRLAKENRWTAAYAGRVIAEYKRFAYLAARAGHAVSPSDPVDQAWHLHLAYSKSYWSHFCPEVLQMPLHHSPTKGGRDETAKFEKWYAQTLRSYEAHFGAKPPADIWPAPSSSERHVDRRSVDCSRVWIVPKPRWSWRAAGIAASLIALTSLAMGTLGVAGIFDWKGPQFLGFYAVAAPLGLLAALAVRWQMRVPHGSPATGDLPQDRYVIAALNGGPINVVNTAIVSLTQQGAAEVVTENKKVLVKPKDKLGSDPHPIERHIFDALSSSSDEISVVRERSASLVEPISRALQDRCWLIGDGLAKRIRLCSFPVAMLVPTLGIIKILVGLQRGKPVGFLVVFVIISAVVGVAVSLSRPRRSVLGDRVLASLRQQFAPRRGEVLRDASPDIAFGIAAAVALYGVSELAATPLDPLRKQLTPPSSGSSSGCGSGCGSSCGGGGGGCGGGCGGCGGGGD